MTHESSSEPKPGAMPVQTMLDTALSWHGQGRLQEAEELYRQILAVDPNHADSLHLLGMIAFQSDDCETAATLIRRAIAINPRAASYHSNLGNVLRQQGHARDAAASYLQALRIRPDLAEVHVNLGNIFLAAKNPDAAVTWYERAIELNPSLPEAHKNHGDALLVQRNLEQAIAAYDRALALRPEYMEAMTELATVLRATGDLDRSLLYLRRLREIYPEHPTAVFREALIYLLQGEFAAGWRCYEQRWGTADHATPMREIPQPLWRGEHLAAGRVLLWPEQGVGDEIMFAGLIPDAMRTGSHFVLECDRRLQPLFARSFPEIEVITDRNAAGDPNCQIEAHLPIASLPSLFRREMGTFAATVSPYLKPDPAKLEQLRLRYGDGRRLIGVSWYSNNEKTGALRSIDLSHWIPLLKCPEFRCVSLQYGDHETLRDQAIAAQATVLLDANVDQMVNMDDFAAQVAGMDLVVTIDNTTAHMAGALGVPVWVLVPFSPDWRWMAEGHTSPWYQTMRIFRQTRRDDWDSVMEQVVDALSCKREE